MSREQSCGSGEEASAASCCEGDMDEEETKSDLLMKDGFVTPPSSVQDVPDFRSAVASQFEMMQTVLIMQYEKDVSLLKEENKILSQRLLAWESTTGAVTNSPPPPLTSSFELQSESAKEPDRCLQQSTDNLSAPENCEHGHQGGPDHAALMVSREVLTEHVVFMDLHEQMEDAKGTAPLESIEIAPTSSCHTPRLDEPIGVPTADVCGTSSENATCKETCQLAGGAAEQYKVLAASAEEHTPLLQRGEPADSRQEFSKLPESSRFSAQLPAKALESFNCEQADENPPQSELFEVDEFKSLPSLSPVKRPERTNSNMRRMRNSACMTKALYDEERPKPDGTESKKKKLRFRSASHAFDIEEAEMTQLQRLVFSSAFDLISGGIIVANSLVFAVKLQHDGFDCGHSVQPSFYKSAAETWPGGALAFKILEYIFTAVFIIELVMRFFAYGLKNALKSAWMWFDFIIVALGFVDTMGAGALGINTSVMRLLRLVRLVRLLKIFQHLQSFDSLFLLIKAVHASLQAMAYSFVMVLVIQIVAGMFMCQTLQPYIQDEGHPVKTREEIFMFFGTFSRTMLTMFEISLGNWVVPCRALTEGVDEMWMLWFLVYRCMFCFALMRVITAVFITETNRVLANDDELTLMKQRREQMEYTKKLTNMFKTIDVDGDGFLSWYELQKLMADEETAEFITTLGFQCHDFEKLFWLIDEGEMQIPIEKFVSKVGKLKGMSKTIDMLTVIKLTHRIEMLLHSVFEKQGLVSHDDARTAEEKEVFSGGAGLN